MTVEIEDYLVQMRTRFSSENAALEGPTNALLNGVIANPESHARFLNTLSALEQMGGHRIMVSQHGRALDLATLKHLSEETRHAFFFKRQAERQMGRPLTYESHEMFAPNSAYQYFKRLEANVKRCFEGRGGARAPYLTMSMIVEFRATWAYQLYQSQLARASVAISLTSLIAEEKGHLLDMARRMDRTGEVNYRVLARLSSVETNLYRRFLQQMLAETGLRQKLFAGADGCTPKNVLPSVATKELRSFSLNKCPASGEMEGGGHGQAAFNSQKCD
jgi:hypothetical protein